MNQEETFLSGNQFKYCDVVTIKDIAARMKVSEYVAGELLREWKLKLRSADRDKLDMRGRITKEDYAFILGLDVRLLYQ